MLLIRTFIKECRTHGIGLFAAAPISEGARMWKFDARIDRLYSALEVATLSGVASMLMRYGQYTESGDLMLCGDDARFTNHSEVPSMLNMDLFAIAAHDIAVGDEITEDYRTFAPGACAEFLNLAATPATN